MQQMMADSTLVNTVAAALIREELYDKVRRRSFPLPLQ